MTDQFFGLTDTGRQRTNNEDTFIAQLSANKKFVIACVIDGVGGYAGGEVAAEIAREIIVQRLERPAGEVIPMLLDCFQTANEKIIREKQKSKEYDSMACVCTLAMVDIENNQFYFAHVGDTRLYLVRDKSLVKISHDQSFVGFLEDSGRLTEDEAMKHPKRNEIYKALGLEANLGKEKDDIETGQSPFLPGDMLLLCSDGLTDMVNAGQISAIVAAEGSCKEKCKKLIDAANYAGGKDNITAVLVQNNKTAQQREVSKPLAGIKPNRDSIKASAEKIAPAQMEKPAKGRGGLIAVLIIFMLVFLGAAVWEYLQNQNMQTPEPVTVAAPVKKQKNIQEIKLQQAIDRAVGHKLILSDSSFTSPIVISDTIHINKDSLLIQNKGKIVLQCDSGYTGPAFKLSSKCKILLLDSLSFSNFQTGIFAVNNIVQIKNTRFINCSVSVQNAYVLPDKKYINGKLPVTIFKADSVPPKKTK